MSMDKVFIRGAAITAIVQLLFWTPVSSVFFIPWIHTKLPWREASLIGLYVGNLPILVFLGVLIFCLLTDKT